jgi:hypothetical protein
MCDKCATTVQQYLPDSVKVIIVLFQWSSCYCLYKLSQTDCVWNLFESSSSVAYFGVTLLNSKLTRFEL